MQVGNAAQVESGKSRWKAGPGWKEDLAGWDLAGRAGTRTRPALRVTDASGSATTSNRTRAGCLSVPCAGDLAASRAAADGGGWSGVAQRRLVLTRNGLLERRPGDYEVGALWVGLEWLIWSCLASEEAGNAPCR